MPPAPPGPVIDEAFVRRVADLARLEVEAAALPALTGQFARILELVSLVQGIDAAGHDPATQAPVGLDALRDDVPGPTLSRREVSGNAPAHDGAFLVVPKFLGNEE